MRYEVVVAEGLENFNARIHERLRQGWRPLGGISLTPALLTADQCGVEEYTYAQAIVRDVDVAEDD